MFGKKKAEIATFQKTIQTLQSQLTAANQTIETCNESLLKQQGEYRAELQTQTVSHNSNQHCTLQQYIRRTQQTEASKIVLGLRSYFYETNKMVYDAASRPSKAHLLTGDAGIYGKEAGFRLWCYVVDTKTGNPYQKNVLGMHDHLLIGLLNAEQVLEFVLDALEVRELSSLSAQKPYHLVFEIDQHADRVRGVLLRWSTEEEIFVKMQYDVDRKEKMQYQTLESGFTLPNPTFVR